MIGNIEKYLGVFINKFKICVIANDELIFFLMIKQD